MLSGWWSTLRRRESQEAAEAAEAGLVRGLAEHSALTLTSSEMALSNLSQ